jgi:hypothetical protein
MWGVRAAGLTRPVQAREALAADKSAADARLHALLAEAEQLRGLLGRKDQELAAGQWQASQHAQAWHGWQAEAARRQEAHAAELAAAAARTAAAQAEVRRNQTRATMRHSPANMGCRLTFGCWGPRRRRRWAITSTCAAAWAACCG